MSAAGYEILEDPATLANRCVTSEDPLALLERAMAPEEPAPLLPSYEDMIEPLLEFLPEREADLLEMYFLKRKRQADIAMVFGVSQAAISYRLDRGIQRIKFLLSVPQLTEEEIRHDLVLIRKPDGKPALKQIDIDILVGMWQTTCQSEVAKLLGITQGRVRHRFFNAVTVIKLAVETDPRLERVAKWFTTIAAKKFCVLHPVKLPQWEGRGIDECT